MHTCVHRTIFIPLQGDGWVEENEVNVQTTTGPHLHGRRLTIARVIWIALLAASLALVVIAVPSGYRHALLTARDLGLARPSLPAGRVAAYLVAVQILFAMGCFVPAGVVLWRRSDNWMAMLVSLVGAMIGTNVSSVFTLHADHPRWHLPIGFVIYFSQMAGIVSAYIFPDGRFVPRWTRPLAIALSAWWVVALLFPAAPFSPETFPGLVVFLLALVLGGTAILAQVHRYAHVSSPTQRQQTKWVVFGSAVGIIGYIGAILVPPALPILGQPGILRAIYVLVIAPAFLLITLAAPLAMTLSILRHRLWDIDFVINRGLVYGSLTALLVVLFSGSLWLISQAFRALTGGQQSLFAVAAAALVFGLLFQPTRRGLQRHIDRRFYGIQIDYQKAKPSPPSAASPVTHPRIGAYSDLELIGRGGMAEVYRATHPELSHPVAIKVLLPDLVRETDSGARFEREAQTAAALKHPNIVRVLDSGKADSTYYMVMEYIAGPDLGSYLDAHGPLPLHQVLPLIRDVASALDYAHQRGLVHRDVKPSNVMLRPILSEETERRDIPYHAVLADFGIAKDHGRSTRLTQTGGVLGTLGYIAPEQIHASTDVDGRADVYAFGATIYELLTGELPFRQQNAGALLLAHLTQPPPDPRESMPDLPDHVTGVLRRALAKSPGLRYATAGDLALALEQGGEGGFP